MVDSLHRRQRRYLLGPGRDLRREWKSSGARYYADPVERAARLTIAGVASPTSLVQEFAHTGITEWKIHQAMNSIWDGNDPLPSKKGRPTYLTGPGEAQLESWIRDLSVPFKEKTRNGLP